MSKLLKLKEWLTLSEAAQHLSIIFGERLTEADILRLSLDGHLCLSVYLTSPTLASRGAFISTSRNPFEGLVFPCDDGDSPKYPDPYIPPLFSMGKGFQAIDRDLITISGLWDLPMVAGERIEIERQYQAATGGSDVSFFSMDGVFVENETGVCKLFTTSLVAHSSDAEASEWFESNVAANRLPVDEYRLVVRTKALREFEQSINDEPERVDKPLATTERNTLLTIIAALCEYSAINPQQRGVASQIAKLTEEIGAGVSEDTVGRHLKKIPDALESRMK